jgi:5-methylcytosine-specific restriction endonuclease McrA
MSGYLEIFNMPRPLKITGRSSTITNVFINSVIPTIPPNEDDVKEALRVLGMDKDTIQCAYCGDQSSEWDHFRPLIIDREPSGYISEIANLVPSCGKCNQSKGNKPWRDWMKSDATRSPKTRGIKDLDDRIERLSKFENWRAPTKVNFASVVGEETWRQHIQNRDDVLDLMRKAQQLADQIKMTIANRANS